MLPRYQMDRGKRRAGCVPNEEERRQRKARREYENIIRQFEPLMEKIDALLQQYRAPEGQEEQQPSNVEESASHAQAHPDEGFADIIRKFLQEFNGNESNEMSRSGHATYQKPHVYKSNEASGSGQSTEQPEGSLNNPKPKDNDLSIDQKLEIAPADLNHKDSA